MGLVFDIQRCSLQDGPGIRTTVFLKGCPLRCVWCHNPESYQPGLQISFQAHRCISCLECVQACEHGAHTCGAQGEHILDRDHCVVCGQCIPACPQEALRVIGQDLSVEAVLAQVEADRIFYTRSGGGMTLSGGEPMFQFAFTRSLLQEARRSGIHTCLETCGQAPRERYTELLPLVDLFLFDFKAARAEKHRAFTGVPNALILENLAYLLDAGAALILRCPLIPGVNDDEDHLQHIAAWSNRRPAPLHIELMPYHDMGNEKAMQVGAEPRLVSIRTADESTQAAWLSRLKNLGCQNVILG
jgi:glycyl-radical enzyme activating protein